MDELARQFVNRYQGNFPICEQPFGEIASELDCGVIDLLETIRGLLEEGILSRFGPLYDAASMGGSLTLAALSVPEERFEEVTELVNDLPEVAHNYHRDHELNMWFVIATETPEGLQQTIDRIEQTANLPVYNFPKLQTFYLGLWLEIDADGSVTTRPIPGPMKQGGMIIDELDRSIVQATQEGLPLLAAPYTEVAGICGCDTETVLQRLRRMLDTGVIRRIGAIPNHYKLGLTGNGMTVWDVDDDRIQELGARVGRLDFVSHCYERPRHLPRWPFNLYAMVHGHDREEVMQKIPEIEQLLGKDCRQHDVLFSKQILKKTGLRLVA